MKILFQRICWNENDWKSPDGLLKREGGYPRKNGFGHEEWNFQIADAYNGFVFGYLRYCPSQKVLRASSGRFIIVFWSREPQTGKKFIVALYQEAMPANKSDVVKLHRHFTKQGIYVRRADELANVPGFTPKKARAEIIRSVRKGTFNFKCKVDKVHVLHPRAPLSDKVDGRPLSQYFTTPTIFDNVPPIIARVISRKSRHLPHVDKNSQGTTRQPIEDSYLRATPAMLKRIIPRHKKLASLFTKWLSKVGYKKIKREVRFVDIEFSDAANLYRAELKTCYGVTTTKAIREALGQLLEYNLFLTRPKAKTWLVVLDEKPSQNDLRFLKKVATIGLPISIYWLSGTKFESHDLTK